MKNLVLMCVIAVLALPILAQDSSQQNSQSQQQQPSSQASQSGQANQASPADSSSGNSRMSGTVSKDGKTFTDSQSNHSYKVDNPDALQGQTGADNVGVIVHVDPDTNTIHIVQVALPPQ